MQNKKKMVTYLFHALMEKRDILFNRGDRSFPIVLSLQAPQSVERAYGVTILGYEECLNLKH